MSIIISIIIGALAGFLAGKLMKGAGFGFWVNLLVGVIGGFLGGNTVVGYLATSVIGSCLLLWVVWFFSKK